MFDDIREPLLQKYKEVDFLNGGCYIFAKLVTEKYNGEVYINRLLEHCAVSYQGKLYDIRGRIKNTSGFRPLKKGEERICKMQYLLKRKNLEQIKQEMPVLACDVKIKY